MILPDKQYCHFQQATEQAEKKRQETQAHTESQQQ